MHLPADYYICAPANRYRGKYARNSFTLMDLAGSERASKTGGKQVSGLEAGMMIEKCIKAGKDPRKELDNGVLGTMINWELTMICNDIHSATERHKQHLGYKSPSIMTTDFNRFVGGCMEGRTRLGMIVCLSPAASNSGETWFSLQMGKNMSKLRVPLKKYKIRTLKGAKGLLKDCEKRLAAAQKKVDNDKEGSKYYAIKLARVVAAANELKILTRLSDDGAGDASTAPAAAEAPVAAAAAAVAEAAAAGKVTEEEKVAAETAEAVVAVAAVAIKDDAGGETKGDKTED